jgi:hypothetical protein
MFVGMWLKATDIRYIRFRFLSHPTSKIQQLVRHYRVVGHLAVEQVD